MTFQVVPDTASFAHQFNGTAGLALEGLTAQYALYVKNEMGWIASQIELTAEAMKAVFISDGAAMMSPAWTLSTIAGKDEGAVFGAQHDESVQQVGTRVGEPAPPSVTALCQLYPAQGPPVRAWFHGPFGVESDVIGERWAAALINGVNAYLTALLPAINAAVLGNTWCIVSRSAGTEVDPTARRAVKRAQAITADVVLRSTRGIIGSQRERRF